MRVCGRWVLVYRVGLGLGVSQSQLKRQHIVSLINCSKKPMTEGEKKGRVILFAIDDNEQSMHALEWALATACLGTAEDRLILIHAQRNSGAYVQSTNPGYILPGHVLNLLEEGDQRSTAKVFARALEICEARKVTPETKVIVGDARDVLCDAVKRFKADMLVLGSHGYGALKRMVLGSVSDHCGHHAECAVFIVKPRDCNASRK